MLRYIEGGARIKDNLQYILERSELHLIEFDIHVRNEMSFMKRSLPYYVMSYHKKGQAKLRLNNEIKEIYPGTVIFIPPHHEFDHYMDTTMETEFLWWHFTLKVGNTIDILRLFQFPHTFTLNNRDYFESIFSEFIRASEQGNYLTRTILKKAKAYELLYLILEGALHSNEGNIMDDQSMSFLSILIHIIKKPEKELRLQDLSKEYHLHPTYISNRFKKIFGKSPIQMQRQLRINQAKVLLKTSQLTVLEIAQSVGYTTVPVFSRMFKNHVGLSPSQYRSLKVLESDEQIN
ncbi:AraC family transcriptional regulator [Lederbergia sp. NSJ-179]|uniref:helix-turn-helix transcriptional regulator n=1 Tax=Lederbergia sp. NSJ-179 TaxID=2931402 RepID=UPI001FD431C3|nr:AraC family transcriptional regulator [Lederbergia sp. NSJ-179]MCJ7842094.1 AraC family transcriptional regulator [Lederbergia sp. NSJ-179]